MRIEGFRSAARNSFLLRGFVLWAFGLIAPSWVFGSENLAYLAIHQGYWQVWVIDFDRPNSAGRVVTTSPVEKSRVSWFPDGQSLLVNSMDGSLRRVDVKTGASMDYALELHGAMDAALSPDGMRIAFSHPTPGQFDDDDLWVMDLDGTSRRRLISRPKRQHQPVWSPDGESIYFLSAEAAPESHDIWKYHLESGSLIMAAPRRLYAFDLAVDAAGRRIYSSNHLGDYELFLDRDGAGERRLTQSPGLDGHPSWSPDGRRLAFHSTRSGSLEIWELEIESGALQQRTHQPGGARNPIWYVPPRVAEP